MRRNLDPNIGCDILHLCVCARIDVLCRCECSYDRSASFTIDNKIMLLKLMIMKREL